MPTESGRDYIRIRGTNIGDKYKIANVIGVEGCDVPIDEETIANARLISAAPELHDALKAILALCGDSFIPAPAHKFEAAIKQARAALREVEGES